MAAIDRDIHAARLVVSKQLPLPGLAAVAALEYAALVAGRAVLSERRHEDDVRVGWMNSDLRDRIGFLEADVGPCLAAVGGPVHAVAGKNVAADAGFPHADEHVVWIRF